MSIIHDALKKIQKDKPSQSEFSYADETPVMSSQEENSATPKKSINLPLIAVALCAIMALFFAVLPRMANKQKISAPATALPAPIKTPAAPFQIFTPAPQDQNVIRIEGIMDMGDKKTALINGNVYEEGQTFNGKMIAKITFEAVTFVDNGKELIVSIKP
jgi:hypothetical protein